MGEGVAEGGKVARDSGSDLGEGFNEVGRKTGRSYEVDVGEKVVGAAEGEGAGVAQVTGLTVMTAAAAALRRGRRLVSRCGEGED